MKYVYVLNENGSWDYEETGKVEVYTSFEKALERFKYLVKIAKQDMNEWGYNIEKEQTIDEEKEYANFEIYEEGEAIRLHDYITVEKRVLDKTEHENYEIINKKEVL